MIKIYFIIICSLLTAASFAQVKRSSDPPKNWPLLDLKQDSYPGMSVEKANKELLKNKKPVKKIIVAVIDDGGFDPTHPDLAGLEWTNKKEIPGNGIDDDHNGFVDDVHGWSFAGDKLDDDTREEIREYVRLRPMFEPATDTLTPQYVYWKKMRTATEEYLAGWKSFIAETDAIIKSFQVVQDYGSKKLGKDTIREADLTQLQPGAAADSTLVRAYEFVRDKVKRRRIAAPKVALLRWVDDKRRQSAPVRQYLYRAQTIIEKNDAGWFRKRDLQDDPYVNTKKNYGNGHVTPIRPEYSHGIGCAGIICAVTHSLEIMPLKEFAGGDEWDKDVANAIRYAVDNGARVVNMSFGKYQSPQKTWVDEAVKYAERKGVLLVIAAGNDAINIDSTASYPSAVYNDHTVATNVIAVGASGFDEHLAAGFSNYGKTRVDVFAPGMAITMTSNAHGYQTQSGTSLAAPMVVGLAALIWSYYPELNYKQVKYCIERSAEPIATLVARPGAESKVAFSSLSKTGGIVNAYKAILIAQSFVKKR